MKKKALFLCLIMILSIFSFTGCGSEKQEDTSASDSKEFVVGFDANFPPYGYKEDGKYKGFDLDLAREVAKRNGWTIKLQPIDWDSKDMELNSGTIDCIWNGFTINGREKKYTWSDAYVDNSQVVVVKKDSGITDLSGLAGKIVAVQTDSSAQSLLESTEKDNKDMYDLNKTFKELQKVPDYNTAFLNLEAGSVDAIAMDIGVAQYQIKNRGSDKFMILDKQLASEQYGVGFKKGNTELRDKVQKTLDKMMDDGTFLKIAKNYGLENSVIIK